MRLTVRLGDEPGIETRNRVYEIEDLRRDNDVLRAKVQEYTSEIRKRERENDALRSGKRFWQVAFVGLFLLAAAAMWPLIGTVVGTR